MKNEIEILKDVSAKLADGSIAYMLTGSMAMNFYAHPRMTRDIDLIIALEPAQIGSILRIFANDYYIASEAVTDALVHHSMFNLIHNESLIKVDCIIRKENEYRRLEFERRKPVQFAGFTTCIVSREDLIISKLDWARDSQSEMQLRDVKNLIRPGLDRVYLEHWIRKLGLHTMWEKCQHE